MRTRQLALLTCPLDRVVGFAQVPWGFKELAIGMVGWSVSFGLVALVSLSAGFILGPRVRRALLPTLRCCLPSQVAPAPAQQSFSVQAQQLTWHQAALARPLTYPYKNSTLAQGFELLPAIPPAFTICGIQVAETLVGLWVIRAVVSSFEPLPPDVLKIDVRWVLAQRPRTHAQAALLPRSAGSWLLAGELGRARAPTCWQSGRTFPSIVPCCTSTPISARPRHIPTLEPCPTPSPQRALPQARRLGLLGAAWHRLVGSSSGRHLGRVQLSRAGHQLRWSGRGGHC